MVFVKLLLAAGGTKSVTRNFLGRVNRVYFLEFKCGQRLDILAFKLSTKITLASQGSADPLDPLSTPMGGTIKHCVVAAHWKQRGGVTWSSDCVWHCYKCMRNSKPKHDDNIPTNTKPHVSVFAYVKLTKSRLGKR